MAGAPNEAAATSHGEMIGALALQLGQRPVTHSLHKNSQHRVWFNDGQDVAPASFQLRDYVNSSDLAEAFVTRREAARVDQDEIAVGTETNSLYDGGVSAVIGRWLGLDD